ncbi:MAG: hypothetical protein IJU76_06000 [Desulfovibrionaceae bacterium]|nr:hypothetical protein [Desulfovibrionaceae bacterium]
MSLKKKKNWNDQVIAELLKSSINDGASMLACTIMSLLVRGYCITIDDVRIHIETHLEKYFFDDTLSERSKI